MQYLPLSILIDLIFILTYRYVSDASNAALCNSRHVSAPLKLSMNIKM